MSTRQLLTKANVIVDTCQQRKIITKNKSILFILFIHPLTHLRNILPQNSVDALPYFIDNIVAIYFFNWFLTKATYCSIKLIIKTHPLVIYINGVTSTNSKQTTYLLTHRLQKLNPSTAMNLYSNETPKSSGVLKSLMRISCLVL